MKNSIQKIIQVTKSKSDDLKKVMNLLLSSNYKDRIEGLIVVNQNPDFWKEKIFEIASTLIEDKDNDCRWQSLIVIGHYMDKRVKETWDIIIKYGNSEDEDMRSAIATILLEHFFEKDIDSKNWYLEDLRQKISREEYSNLKKTLRICWSDELKTEFKELSMD